jgi:hypothetical protein
MDHALDADWQLLLELFPLGWEQVAVFSGALERLRGFSAAGDRRLAGAAVTLE